MFGSQSFKDKLQHVCFMENVKKTIKRFDSFLVIFHNACEHRVCSLTGQSVQIHNLSALTHSVKNSEHFGLCSATTAAAACSNAFIFCCRNIFRFLIYEMFFLCLYGLLYVVNYAPSVSTNNSTVTQVSVFGCENVSRFLTTLNNKWTTFSCVFSPDYKKKRI